jgi:aromatic ring hydroxylase
MVHRQISQNVADGVYALLIAITTHPKVQRKITDSKEKLPTSKKNYLHTKPHHKEHHQHTNTTKQHHDTQQNKTSWSLMKSRKVLSTWRQWQTAGCVRTCWDNICALRQGTGASEKHLVSALNLPSCYGYISTCQMKDQKEDGKYICYGL